MDADVVIPAFRPEPALLAGAIASARGVPGVRRIIVIDDGSPEPVALPDAAGGPGGHAPCVELVRQDNTGPSGARNRGLDLADAPAVLFLDADDTLLSDGMVHLFDLIERTGAIAGLPARIERTPEGAERLKEIPPQWRDGVLNSPHDTWRPTVLFSTSGLVLTGPARALRFDESICVVEDRELMHRAALLGPFAMGSRPGVVMTIHAGGSNLTSPRHFATRVRGHAALVERYLTDHTPDSARRDWREATRWLLNNVAKAPVDDETWALLSHTAARVGCPVPLKARVRRGVRRMLARR